jgi:uncharacterized radical SAM superfamily Fe-S cluster-containing enzyme
MDANQVGFVHELLDGRRKEILDNAISIKPRRQMSVQYSGGEPTLSPYFLEAIRYARKVGYNSVQAGNKRNRFAKSKNSAAKQPKPDCVSFTCNLTESATMRTRIVKSAILFDVKLRANQQLARSRR